jgi:hypothetical protein
LLGDEDSSDRLTARAVPERAMHVENTPLCDGIEGGRIYTPVPKSEGPGAPSELARMDAVKSA